MLFCGQKCGLYVCEHYFFDISIRVCFGKFKGVFLFQVTIKIYNFSKLPWIFLFHYQLLCDHPEKTIVHLDIGKNI
jgi:hypothetical protein